MDQFLQKILRARVYEVAIETPLEKAKNLSKRLSNNIWLKREDLQKVFSFKIRGAFNRMQQLTEQELKKGVIASSAGNHAQGVAYSALFFKTKALIVMPLTTPKVKVLAVKSLKAEVILYGDTYDEAYFHAISVSKNRGLTFIHPFDDLDVIAGQGTIGVEILRQSDEPPDSIYIAVGGGGLISGVASYVKNLWPNVEIIGVEPYDSAAMTQSLSAGKIVELNEVGLFADGVAVRKVGKNTFSITKKYVDFMINVSNDEICSAIKDVFEDTRSILEPAGALSIAGMKSDIEKRGLKNKNLVAIACGANMNFERLRFVAERAELGEDREFMVAIEIPEKPGSLIDLCELLGKKSLSEFSYRMSESSKAHIFMGIKVDNNKDKELLINKFNKANFNCIDLSNDELSKTHLRHMVGGRLPKINDTNKENANEPIELLYRFEFPERPGALINFLKRMKTDWTISIFHYRNHGSDIGRIVIGILVLKSDLPKWNNFIAELGYKCVDETKNQAYKLFLGAN